jgi:putative ABC transport system permease protein
LNRLVRFFQGNVVTEIRSRLRALLRRGSVESELNDELRFHFDQQVEKFARAGVPADEAQRRAKLLFGGTEQIKEECREARGIHLLETLAQDVRYGLRILRKSPGFTLTVILTLALGIGATTAIFSVVQGAMLAPLPYRDPDELVLIWQSNPHAPHVSMSLPDLRDWQQSAHSFEWITGERWYEFDLTNPGPPERVSGYETSAGFFEMLGVHPLLGRLISPEEDRPGGAPVALISEGEWKNRFGGSPDVLGKSLTLSGVAYTIIGIMPSTFRLASPVDVYIPLGQGDPLYNDRRYPGVLCLARLKRGVSIAQAQREMTAVQQRLNQLYPGTDQGLGTDVVPLKPAIVGDISATLLLMLGAVVAVLLIACANIANLLLARSAARVREFTIRASLGAAHSRIVRQLLTESILLSIAGGAVGLLFAKLGVRAVLALLGENLRRAENVTLNGTVLLFTLGISLIVGIIFGLAPAFKSLPSDLHGRLKQGARGSTATHHGAQSALVISQVAVTLVLLAGATLLLRTIRDLRQTDPGFETQNLITFKIGLSHAASQNAGETRTSYQNVIQSIRSIPGVEWADASNVLPLSQFNNFAPFWLGSHETTPVAEAPRMLMYWTGPDYIRTMKIPLLQGRYFTDQDYANAQRVTVIDSVMAQSYFPGKNPIGESITVNLWGDARIIGVVGHIRHSSLGDPVALTQAQAYAPLNQLSDAGVPGVYGALTFIVRTPLEVSSIMPQVEATVAGRNGGQPVYEVRSMREVIAESLTPQRFPMILLSTFAALGLLLAALGTYGVMSYFTIQRTAEIGIRMALGAERHTVFQMVLRQGMRLALFGVGIGAVAALLLARTLSSFSHLLYGVRAGDPLTLVSVSILLLAATLFACYLPARRAMSTNLIVALRHE